MFYLEISNKVESYRLKSDHQRIELIFATKDTIQRKNNKKTSIVSQKTYDNDWQDNHEHAGVNQKNEHRILMID